MYLWTCYYYLVFCPSLALSLFFFFLDIFATDFWSTSKPVSHEVALLMEKLKFTALASRNPGTSLNYTRVFNRWRSFLQTSWVLLYFLWSPSPLCFYSICWIQASQLLPLIPLSMLSNGCTIWLVSVLQQVTPQW